ncbi:DeoR/GlpR family transcriptional regulator [Streptomyces sp. NA04227]|uniref:substrate-binding domain-containing protein n=1 Tax=Streptomyces sp. NA04227 TaxID=2742136 RepID=UPI001590EB55|nr:substrate-binding domain-containing protein [Streptomyces sp. NA04227]QKW09769.1 DeoR/GlpR family transcriptional regulator [Streptomyces sp. NA04227]
MTSSAQERRARILETVRALGSVRVVDLAESLGFPAVTVRRDVAALAQEGRLLRTHGSVALPDEEAGRGADGAERVLGMLVPTVGGYFDEVVAGASAAAAAAGARLILGIAPYEASDDRSQVERLLESDVDGLLLVPNWRPGEGIVESDWLAELPVPAVLVERRAAPASPAAGLDAVCSDHRHGVLLALHHLARLGHRSVLLAARDDTRTAHEVRAGYAEAVKLLGLTELPVVDVPRAGGGAAAVAEQIAAAARAGARAVLVHNDQDAIQLPPLLRTFGLGVPEDMALISYDDTFAALSAPPLTAVAPPKRAVGAGALELLVRRIAAGPELPVHHTELQPSLKVRSSCGGGNGGGA